MMQKAVFFDRDGVLNHAIIREGKPYPPENLSECVIPQDAKEALSLLRNAGYLLIGATNQPDVARKKTTIEEVQMINQYICEELALLDLRVCYHDDDDHCVCRKPKPGLLIQAATDYHIDLSLSFMVGDRWKDIDAGMNAGCRTIWLRNQYDVPSNAHFIADSLMDVAHWIVMSKISS